MDLKSNLAAHASNDSSSKDAVSDAIDEAAAFAHESGLRYVSDRDHGFLRKRAGKGFFYVDHQANRVTSDSALHRIESLVLPPAWNDVWICRFGNGHLQATGRDARSRKQYRYHATWNQTRNETKFQKLVSFGEVLPKLRARVRRDLATPGLGREKVLAAVVDTMEKTMIRIGNDCYAEENDSYGLTTLLSKHTDIHGAQVHFKFRAKSGIETDITFRDPKLSRVIHKCQDLPGQELFAFIDETGHVHDVESGDVNSYLHEIAGDAVTAKSFRTWGATTKAAEILHAMGPLEAKTQTAQKKRHVEVCKQTAEYLSNTVAVCRKYYIHPEIFAADLDGRLEKAFKKVSSSHSAGLSRAEKAILAVLG